MRRVLDGNPKITSTHGQATNMGFFGKHLGYDYGVPVGTVVKAPVSGRIGSSAWSDNLGNWLELIGDDGRTHRIAHLSRRDVSNNQRVTEGQQLGLSGATGIVTGPHVHHDVRKAGTAWNASFANYHDWEKLLAEANKPVPTKSKVFLPSSAGRWRLYPVDAFPRIGNERAFLRPDQFPPGLTYDIIRYLDSGNTVEIKTQMFGNGKVWIKNTDAVVR